MIQLKKGQNLIKTSHRLIQSKGCGIFPINEKVDLIQTKGLKWNMGNEGDSIHSLDWNTNVSSSNEMIDSTITINNSNPVLFVAQINDTFQR